MTALKLLIAGDLHIGRASSRLEAEVGVDATARGAWDRIVEAAIREEVQLLCLAGDISDASNRFWEAVGPLERGVKRLAKQGIRTLAVSGNHDHDVLPRLAAQLDPQAFRLLGPGGRWDRYTHVIDGAPVLHVDGWSFPQERVRTSPVPDYRPTPDAAVPAVALVHGDLGAPASPYAPLDRQELLSRPVAGWFLGHIHAPMVDQEEGRPLLVYPGSPQALDPGEAGVHGAVLAELRHGRLLPVRRIPLSTVRYDATEIDVTAVQDEPTFSRRVREHVQALSATAAREGGGVLRHLVLRLTLGGRTVLARTLRNEAAALEADFAATIEGVRVSVDRVRLDVLPELDLETQARSGTPPGLLARMLLDLDAARSAEQMSPGVRRLLRAARDRMAEQRGSPAYAGLSARDIDPAADEVRRVVREQAEALLTEMLGQRS